MESQTPNPLLSRLNRLVGTWDTVASVNGKVMARGRAMFQWTHDGAFLLERDETVVADDADPIWIANAPRAATQIIGLDDAAERFSVLYADSRRVYRVYQMTLEDDTWTIWRDSPGFNQRFVGTFDPAGTTVTGRYEFSADGSTWTTDFYLDYTKID
jgi:hypothetical protein